MPDRKLPDLTLLPVAVAVDWERGPFVERARRVLASEGLPEWKLTETSRSMERIFAMAEAAGKSPDEALKHLDAEISRLFPTIGGIVAR